jgi:LysM repeat protein
MVPIASFALSALASSASSNPACDDDASGWSCVTVADGDTVFSIALAHRLSPAKLCDLNRNTLQSFNCSFLEVGQSLRVPTSDACTPVPGAWSCYDVADHDNLFNIARSHGISESYLESYNKRALWGAPYPGGLWAGTQLRIPQYRCNPTANWDCHVLAEGEDILSVSAAHFINPTIVIQANHRLASYSLQPGAQLRVPRTHPSTWDDTFWPGPDGNVPGGGGSLMTAHGAARTAPANISVTRSRPTTR